MCGTACICGGQRTTLGSLFLPYLVRQCLSFVVSAVLWSAGGPDPRLPNLVLHHRSAGITDVRHHIELFTWPPGIRHRPSVLQGSHSYSLAIFLAPSLSLEVSLTRQECWPTPMIPSPGRWELEDHGFKVIWDNLRCLRSCLPKQTKQSPNSLLSLEFLRGRPQGGPP